MEKKTTVQPRAASKGELLSKRVIEEEVADDDSDSLKDWSPADAALDALPPVDEMVEVVSSLTSKA